MKALKKDIPVSYRLPWPVVFLLTALAIASDVFQILLKLLWFTVVLGVVGEALGWFISMMVILISSVIYIACKVNFATGTGVMRKIIRMIITILIEFFPFLNLLPSLTIWTILTIRESRKEDRKNAVRNATMEEARHVQLRKKRLRERMLLRAGKMIPQTRAIALAAERAARREDRRTMNARGAGRTPANDNSPEPARTSRDGAFEHDRKAPANDNGPYASARRRKAA